jgi:hypothetical protein
MDKRKWLRNWLERMGAGLMLAVFVLGCGFLAQITAESPAAAVALTSRATR